MRRGGWVPLSKAFVTKLPTNRSFSEVEAVFSLTLSYDDEAQVTVAGLAARWGWSRGKVRRFLEQVGASIQYPEGTAKNQNQRGQIVIQIADRSSLKNGQIRMIDSRQLSDSKDRSYFENGQMTDRSRYSIKILDPKPKEKPFSSQKKAAAKEAVEIANFLAEKISSRDPANSQLINGKRENTIGRWAADIGKINLIDGRSWADIESVLEFSQSDEFWSKNILSGATLRKQFDKLIQKMPAEAPAKKIGGYTLI